MRTFTMEGQDEGDQYLRAGALEAELYANGVGVTPDGGPADRKWREPEVVMSEEATHGPRGIESNVSDQRRGVGYATGHLLLSRPHIVGPENFIG